jgi:predicted amino acid-binding ACT domain protein
MAFNSMIRASIIRIRPQRNRSNKCPRILHLVSFLPVTHIPTYLLTSVFNLTQTNLQRSYLSTFSAAASTTPAPSRYIVHASGLDRLWIVNDVAEKVIESGGNVAESKAAKLGQYFSIMMLVEVHGDKGGCADEMRSLLSSLPDLNVAVFEAKETAAKAPSVACKSVNSVSKSSRLPSISQQSHLGPVCTTN